MNLFVIGGESCIYGDCALVSILEHHPKLEGGLDANIKRHVVCCNGSLDQPTRVLVEEHEVQIFPHPHSDTFGVIRVLHI